jgi:hypothetical protein
MGGIRVCGSKKSFHLRRSIVDSHLRGSVENVLSVSSMDNSLTLVGNVETSAFISERTHSPITLRFWVNMWCVSHKNIALEKDVPQYSMVPSEKTPPTMVSQAFDFRKGPGYLY